MIDIIHVIRMSSGSVRAAGLRSAARARGHEPFAVAGGRGGEGLRLLLAPSGALRRHLGAERLHRGLPRRLRLREVAAGRLLRAGLRALRGELPLRPLRLPRLGRSEKALGAKRRGDAPAAAEGADGPLASGAVQKRALRGYRKRR